MHCEAASYLRGFKTMILASDSTLESPGELLRPTSACVIGCFFFFFPPSSLGDFKMQQVGNLCFSCRVVGTRTG